MIVKVNNVIYLLFAFILTSKYIETKSVNASSKIFSEENDEISREHDANSINKLLHYILNNGEKLTILEESNKHLTQEDKLKKLKSVLHQLVIFFDEIKNQNTDEEDHNSSNISEYNLNDQENSMRHLLRLKKSKFMNKKSWNIPMRAFKWNNKAQSKSNTPQKVYDQLLKELNS
jgi:hypothetical protein